MPALRQSRDTGTELDQTKAKALESLEPISNKLLGLQVTSDPDSLGAKEVTVEEQVERLIREARDPKNLGSMYVGLRTTPLFTRSALRRPLTLLIVIPQLLLSALKLGSTVCSDAAISFLRGLPKCEHHMHIEGSLEPEMLFALAEKNKIALDPAMYTTIPALQERYCNFSNLDDFLAYFNKAMDVLLYEDDFADLAYGYMKRVHTDGLVHAEVFFDPQAHTGRGVALESVVRGLNKGLKKGEAEFGITHKLIKCFVKHLSVESAIESLEACAPYFQSGEIHGLGADSTEKNNPREPTNSSAVARIDGLISDKGEPSKFASIYERARALGVKNLTMHSGEEGPASWVRQTVEDLGINRVDHGVHVSIDRLDLYDIVLIPRLRLILMDQQAADDPQLLIDLAFRRTFLTICPLSNVRLKVHKDVRESPIPKLMEAGVPFSINSDDPSYFGGYILDNYIAVHEAFNFSKEVWRQLAVNSVYGSWCAAERKEEIIRLIDAHMTEWADKEL
ncbi:SPOSA6832_00438, partial [Sporobolomyces salmonicolor]